MKSLELNRYALAIGAAAALLAGCGGSQPPIAAPGVMVQNHAINVTMATQHETFNYTGAEQSFKVPAAVTRIDVDARGAAGTGHKPGYIGSPGNGGRVTATIPVQAGQTLDVFVGGKGSGETGGFNVAGTAEAAPPAVMGPAVVARRMSDSTAIHYRTASLWQARAVA
jgi:hypothetical protein